MATKLTKAQERELQLITEQYAGILQRQKDSFKHDLDNAVAENLDDRYIQYYTESLDLANQGFILWRCPNIKTLQKLADLGYIEYRPDKQFRRVCSPIDRVKLL